MGEKQKAGGQVRQNNNGVYVFFILFALAVFSPVCRKRGENTNESG